MANGDKVGVAARQFVMNAERRRAMVWNIRPLLAALLMLTLPLAGCITTTPTVERSALEGEELVVVDSPCSLPTQSLTQSSTIVSVNGVDRLFRLSVPSSDAGTELPLVLAFHGGDMAEDDFPQQEEFDALGEQDKFIMAYAVAEEGRTQAEGEWYLNTAATSRDDNNFAMAIVDALSEVYCVDQNRLYATGYSLGSMFTYEIACQMNSRFAAVASFAGTMPVEPESCYLYNDVAVMHIHGKLDLIIDYDDDWDWKDGEHEGVGTMSSVPGLIEDWAARANCQSQNSEYNMAVEHVIHSDCDGGVRIEHHGMELNGHSWPNQVAGTDTAEVIWNFLREFSLD